MSIIEEALRRAEGAPKPSSSAPAPHTTASSAIETLPTPVTPSRSRVSAALVVGIAISVLLAAWGMRQAVLSTAPRTPPASDTAASASHMLVPPTGMEFMLPAAEAIGQPPLRLSGIVTQPGDPVAVINDRIVRVGDVIDGATVVEIATSGVIVERNDTRLTLNFSR